MSQPQHVHDLGGGGVDVVRVVMYFSLIVEDATPVESDVATVVGDEYDERSAAEGGDESGRSDEEKSNFFKRRASPRRNSAKYPLPPADTPFLHQIVFNSLSLCRKAKQVLKYFKQLAFITARQL
jgi:hypothetical protein